MATAATRAAGPKHAFSDEVIEIESSPEPVPLPVPRSCEALKARNAAGGSSKGKEKGKATRKAASFPGPVIELTDSDSDSEMQHPQSHSQPQPHRQTQANRSGGSSQALQPVPIGVSTSLENIPGPSSKKRKVPEPIPLFLQSQSDEENEPPFLRTEDDAAPVIHPRKRVHRAENSEERVQVKDKGKGKARALDSDDEWDRDPVLAAKPFPNFFDNIKHNTEQKANGSAIPLFQDVKIIQPLRPIPAATANPRTLASPADPSPIGAEAASTSNSQTMEQQQPQPPPAFDPEPEPAPPVDPISQTIAQILEIVPDVEPEYLLGLVHTHLPNFAGQTVEHIVGILFETGDYPKVDPRNKGKRKALDEPEGAGGFNKRAKTEEKEPEVDYGSVDRPFSGGPHYTDMALIQLQASFPLIPKPYLRRILQEKRGLYAPAHLALIASEQRFIDLHRERGGDMRYEVYVRTCGLRPYHQKSTPYIYHKDKKKLGNVIDEDFVKERRWLLDRVREKDPDEVRRDVGFGTGPEAQGDASVAGTSGNGKGKERAVEPVDEGPNPVEEGSGIECQCCFSEYAFDDMVQCPEAHLFCSSCVSQYAATKLGEHDTRIVCMHSSGCSLPFPVSELRRILSPKLMSLFERVQQQKELEAAGLEGLEECPFCDWKCVLEVSKEEEKLFRCGNEEGGCGVVSCRSCKKKDHLPKSCKEVEEDKLLDGRHAIEEAMTRALMRNCPQCNKPFIKEQGCNKMTCPNCRTLSCYICRKVISGYEHFDQTPAGHPSTSRANKGKCPLFDHVEERHAAEVKAAAEKAMEQYKRDHPDVDEKDIKVDLPPPPPAPPAPRVPGGGWPGAGPIGRVGLAAFHHLPRNHQNMAYGLPALAGGPGGHMMHLAQPVVPPPIHGHPLPPFPPPHAPAPRVRQTRAQQRAAQAQRRQAERQAGLVERMQEERRKLDELEAQLRREQEQQRQGQMQRVLERHRQAEERERERLQAAYREMAEAHRRDAEARAQVDRDMRQAEARAQAERDRRQAEARLMNTRYQEEMRAQMMQNQHLEMQRRMQQQQHERQAAIDRQFLQYRANDAAQRAAAVQALHHHAGGPVLRGAAPPPNVNVHVNVVPPINPPRAVTRRSKK